MTTASSLPLAPAGYLVPSEQLPRATAAAWMRHILLVTLAASLVATVAVLVGPLDETIPLNGEIRPATYAYASPSAVGTLKTILVHEGETVAAGTLLATLDNWALTRDLAQLDADLSTARAELERDLAFARKITAVPVPGEFFFSTLEVEKQRSLIALQKEHLARTEKLASLGSASEVELMNLRMQMLTSEALLARLERASALATGDYGQASVAEAEASLAASTARIAAMETRRQGLLGELARLEIRATIAGVVTATPRLYPGLAVSPGQALFKIAPPGQVVLRLNATEDRISEIHPGLPVRFRSHSNPDRLAPYATAVVTEVSPERELTGSTLLSGSIKNTGDYQVNAADLKARYALPPGSRVDAEIVLRSRPLYQLWLNDI